MQQWWVVCEVFWQFSSPVLSGPCTWKRVLKVSHTNKQDWFSNGRRRLFATFSFTNPQIMIMYHDHLSCILCVSTLALLDDSVFMSDVIESYGKWFLRKTNIQAHSHSIVLVHVHNAHTELVISETRMSFDHQTQFMAHMAELRNNTDDADVTLLCQGEVIKAHSNVLGIRSAWHRVQTHKCNATKVLKWNKSSF